MRLERYIWPCAVCRNSMWPKIGMLIALSFIWFRPNSWPFWPTLVAGLVVLIASQITAHKLHVRKKIENDGPCYDFCYCPHCWNGWSTIPFYHRLWEHLKWRWHYATTGEWL